MYISNLTHFLDEQGNIASVMHKEGREMASFLALEVDFATFHYVPFKKRSNIKCLSRKCTGIIEIEIDIIDELVYWSCDKCAESGRISDWQNTKWDNRK